MHERAQLVIAAIGAVGVDDVRPVPGLDAEDGVDAVEALRARPAAEEVLLGHKHDVALRCSSEKSLPAPSASTSMAEP